MKKEPSLGLRHLFGLTKESCIHCHPAAFAALEAKVVDPILAITGWLKTLGATPVAPGHPTLDFAYAARAERNRPTIGADESMGFLW